MANHRASAIDAQEPSRIVPRPLILGAVGHRMNRLTTRDISCIETRVARVLDALCRPLTLQSDNMPCPRVVSSLAEGSDRVVARIAAERGLLATACLPCSPERFEHDFADDASIEEFRRLLRAAESVVVVPLETSTHRNGYEAASDAIVDQADILLAIWNGLPGRGAGGTAHAVKRASVRGIPLIWIESHSPYRIRAELPAASETAFMQEALEAIGRLAATPDS
jgi:hypothetical protein